MDLGLKDKVVVITGGAGAIGSAAAECFLREGCVVILGDCDQNCGAQVITTTLSFNPRSMQLVTSSAI